MVKNKEKSKEGSSDEANQKVFVYLRCSTDKQDIDAHKAEIDRYCQDHKFTNVRYILDEAISGYKPWKKRKIYDIVETAGAGSILVVSELSRLSRKQLELLTILQRCIEREIIVHSIKERFINDNSPTSVMMRGMFATMAEMERSMTSERVKSGMETKRQKGIRNGPPPQSILEPFKEEIRKHVEEGKKPRFIQEKYGVTYRHAKYYIQSRGFIEIKKHSPDIMTNTYIDDRTLSLPSGTYRKLLYDKYIDILNEEIKNPANKSIKDIANKYDWAKEQTLKKYLKTRME